jgi:hypothetical protein
VDLLRLDIEGKGCGFPNPNITGPH